jgi:hypothetical protein
MHPTEFVYSSHSCSSYMYGTYLVEPALKHPTDHRLLYLPMSEVPVDGSDQAGQEFGWNKVSWYLEKFRESGLAPQNFYWSEGLRRPDVDVLVDLLENAAVVILGGGNTGLGNSRYQDIGRRFWMDTDRIGQLLRKRHEKGLLTGGYSAGAEQLIGTSTGVAENRDNPQGFGLVRDMRLILHHEWSRREELAELAAHSPNCVTFGLPNDSGLAIRQGKLPNGRQWQWIRCVVDTSWDAPNDQFHIKTRSGLRIDHYYPNGQHWSFNDGDELLRLWSENDTESRTYFIMNKRAFDYYSREPIELPELAQIVE